MIRDEWALPTQRYLKRAVKEFFQTFKIMKVNSNPRELLEHYLTIGKIRYTDGTFVGEIPAAIALQLKEYGAVWDMTLKGWKIDLARLPHRVALMIQQKTKENQERRDLLLAAVMVAPAIIESFLDSNILQQYGAEVVDDVYRAHDIQSLPLPSARALPTYDARVQEAMRRLAAKEPSRIADKVTEIYQKGGDVEAFLAKRKKVMEYKAQVIARSEMGVEANEALAAFHISEGRPYYRWVTQGDGIVRPDHRELDNTVQRWDNPPIVDKHTGYRGHPGSAANCRCDAIPLKKKGTV